MMGYSPMPSNLQHRVPKVHIVDDDPLVRDALTRVFRSAELRVATYESAQAFLDRDKDDGPGCVILDVQLPDKSGMQLQQTLIERDIDLPVIFLTGHGDIPMTVQAMRSGAINFFTKPVTSEELLTAVHAAIQDHESQRADNAELDEFRRRVDTLSARERQVMSLAISGLLNKQIASRLGITERTVKEHRGRVMRKTDIDSIAELARLCERAGIVDPED